MMEGKGITNVLNTSAGEFSLLSLFAASSMIGR